MGRRWDRGFSVSQYFGLIITIEKTNNWYKVAIFDATSTDADKLPVAEGDGSHWRTALGQALAVIELPEKEEDNNEQSNT